MKRATSGRESKLAKMRIERGLAQRELAELSGMNIRQIQSFESGERDIANASLKNGIRLAEILGVHPRELLA